MGGGQEVDSGWVAGEGVFLDLVYYVTQVFSYSILNVSVKIVLCLSRNLLFAISYFLFSVFQRKLKEYPVLEILNHKQLWTGHTI